MTGGASPARRRLALGVVGLGVSAVALWLALRGVDLAATGEVLRGAAAGPLIVALGVLAVQAGLRAARWRGIVSAVAGRPVGLRPVLLAMLSGYLGNAVLPARLGEVVRSGLLARTAAIPIPTVLGSAVVERLVDILLLALLGVIVLALVAAPGWVVVPVVLGAIGATLALVIVAVVAGRSDRPRWLPAVPVRLAAPLSQLRAGLDAARGRRVLGVAALLTLVAWLLDAAIMTLVARSLGIDLPPAAAMLVSVIVVLSTAIPSAPGYIGTFELAAVAAIGLIGVAGPQAVAFAVLAHVVTLVPLAVAGAGALLLQLGASRIGGPAPARLAR